MENITVSLLGGGNIACSITQGFLNKKIIPPQNITISRRKLNLLKEYKERGCQITNENKLAITNSKFIFLCVTPNQIHELLNEIKDSNFQNKILISLVSGVDIKFLKQSLGEHVPIIRAMPNTAASLNESMSCLTSSQKDLNSLLECEQIFKSLGETLIIEEEQMESATALGACGLAFFLRAIRAASQGGIEIGFHSQEASQIAAQTAKGAALLLMKNSHHPEFEIDKVTTPMGATISGLNEMEHRGFSSSFIKGIITSANKIRNLFTKTSY